MEQSAVTQQYTTAYLQSEILVGGWPIECLAVLQKFIVQVYGSPSP